MRNIRNKEFCFQKEYDAVICGGGIAGCTAAIACARNHLKTAVVEKQVMLGGLATSGLVLVYLPLCDGRGRQIIRGLSHFFLQKCNEYGPSEINRNWKEGGRTNRLCAYFSPASFVMSLDKLMEEYGIDVWFDTRITGVKLAPGGSRVKKICVDNKSGHGEISGDVFIDTTGDADLAFFSGKQLHEAKNSLVTWVIEHREKVNSSSFTFGRDVSTLICAEQLNSNTVPAGINGKLLSEYMMATRKKYREEHLLTSYKENENRTTRYPLTLPAMAPLRHTRCILGEYMLEDKDEMASFIDSVGVIPDWRKCDNLMEIPFRAFIPKGLKNVLAAGRTLSAKEDAWEMTRVIPAAAMTGEVAGEAAAIYIQKKCKDFRMLDVLTLQNILRKKCDFPIHYDEIK